MFTSGFVRTFDVGNETAHPFDQLPVDGIGETPNDFAKEARDPEEMNYFELRDYVES